MRISYLSWQQQIFYTQKTILPFRKNRKSHKSYHHSDEMPCGVVEIDSCKIGRLSDVLGRKV
jgi:hypothetical protein